MLTSFVLAAVASDPYAIFARARDYWLTQTYPSSLRYRIDINITEGGKPRSERYDAWFDTMVNEVHVDPVSDYELEHPVVVRGANFSVLGAQLNKPLPTDDFLGVPHLTPVYTFGMAPFAPKAAASQNPYDSPALVAEIRKEFHDTAPRAMPNPATHGLKEIAVVAAGRRDYAIALVDTETLDGHACFHLALTPVRDPQRNRIREAWIDTSTFATWQLKDATNFATGPATSVPWTIRFADVAGAHYVSEEIADAPMRAQGQIYTTARVSFESIQPGALPGQPFEPPQDHMLTEP